MMITPKDIDKIVSYMFRISVTKLHSEATERKVTDARNLAMLKCRQYLGYSTLKLKKYYGKDSHTTIMSDLKSAKNLIETNRMASDRALEVDRLIRERIQELILDRQRYNLHYRIRQKGIRVNMKDRYVSIRAGQEELLKKGQLMKLLKKHGYSVQYAII